MVKTAGAISPFFTQKKGAKKETDPAKGAI